MDSTYDGFNAAEAAMAESRIKIRDLTRQLAVANTLLESSQGALRDVMNECAAANKRANIYLGEMVRLQEREREFERAREAFNDWDNNQYPKTSLNVVREYFNPAKEGE